MSSCNKVCRNSFTSYAGIISAGVWFLLIQYVFYREVRK